MNRNRIVGAMILLLVTVLIGSTTLVFAEVPKSGGTLRLGMYRDVVNLDPHIASGMTYTLVQMNVYDNLVGFAPDGSMAPHLATSWETADSQTWILHLREGVSFSNGNAFTAEDVVYSIERILNPDTAASRKAQLDVIESMRVIDMYTVEITLSEPNAVFIDLLTIAACAMVDKEWAEAGGDFSTEALGTGPFVLESYERGVEYVLARNFHYWEPGKPYLDSVVLLPISTNATRMNALKNGEIDFADYIPWSEMLTLEASPDFELLVGNSAFMYVRLNVSREPFDNKLVRQAMNYAIDRDVINDLAWGGFGQTISAGLLYPGSTFYNEDLERWSYDPDKALDLIRQAGYEPGDIHLTVETIENAVHYDTAIVIQQQLSVLGFQVDMQINPVALLNEKRVTGDYQFMVDGGGTSMVDPDWMSLYFHPETGGTYALGVGFNVPELGDQFLIERTSVALADRQAAFRRIDEILLDECPFIFILWRPQGEAFASYVKGYTSIPVTINISEAYLENIWLDK